MIIYNLVKQIRLMFRQINQIGFLLSNGFSCRLFQILYLLLLLHVSLACYMFHIFPKGYIYIYIYMVNSHTCFGNWSHRKSISDDNRNIAGPYYGKFFLLLQQDMSTGILILVCLFM